MINDRERIAFLEELVLSQMAKLAEACARNGNMAAELAAMTHERDSLRREVDALVEVAVEVPCCECNARDFCFNMRFAKPCGEMLRAWAKQAA